MNTQIGNRIKALLYKGFRFVKFGFSKSRNRSGNTIFLASVTRTCDFCKNPDSPCVVLEGDYEVYSSICRKCVTQIVGVLGLEPNTQVVPFAYAVAHTKDPRGVIL